MTSLRFLKDVGAGSLTFLTNLGCSLLLLPIVYSSLTIRPEELAVVATMGVFQLGIPYWLFSKAVEEVPVQEASLIVLVEPVLNPVWVALAVGEIPSLPTVVGGGFILSSLAVRYLLHNGRRPALS
jgi:drug/metabolite transporter (DMT)-like permease